ncbi:hypothetical protein KUCAC02_028433 [Chaenocephalus aceratus]|uniref:Uncharacterized protein n=1 Tax=Chaenocephalus aceratus TaxID=36190 RepID=A0ACB9X1U6_CHAAC|nr:hypothetical protein KUCAC02_028433 [Chaenocephalus aceratus]
MELLSQLQEKLIGASSDSETSTLIGHVEQLFKIADPNGCSQPIKMMGGRSFRRLTAICSTFVRVSCHSFPGPALDQLLLQSWGLGALQEALLRTGGWRDSPHLLMGGGSQTKEGEEEGKNRGILRGILDILQPQLTKDLWHRYEAVKLVFAWTLLQTTSDKRTAFWEYAVCIILYSTRLLLICVSSTEQKFSTRCYSNIFRVLSCLLDLLVVLEKPPSSLAPSSSRRKPCRHDDVAPSGPDSMEAEHRSERRRVYASALPLSHRQDGRGGCRHLRQVERGGLETWRSQIHLKRRERLKIREGAWLLSDTNWDDREVFQCSSRTSEHNIFPLKT